MLPLVLVRGSALFPLTSLVARDLAAFCCATIRGSSCCDRSHQTVAFCFLIKAT